MALDSPETRFYRFARSIKQITQREVHINASEGSASVEGKNGKWKAEVTKEPLALRVVKSSGQIFSATDPSVWIEYHPSVRVVFKDHENLKRRAAFSSTGVKIYG